MALLPLPGKTVPDGIKVKYLWHNASSSAYVLCSNSVAWDPYSNWTFAKSSVNAAVELSPFGCLNNSIL